MANEKRQMKDVQKAIDDLLRSSGSKAMHRETIGGKPGLLCDERHYFDGKGERIYIMFYSKNQHRRIAQLKKIRDAGKNLVVWEPLE